MRNGPGEMSMLRAWREHSLAMAGVVAVAVMVASGSLAPPNLRAQSPAGKPSASAEEQLGRKTVLADQPNAAAFQSVTIHASHLGPADSGWNTHAGPGSFQADMSLRRFIAYAYDVQPALISGPDALDAKYDVDATTQDLFTAGYESPVDALRAMVRKMLDDRFHLQVHHGTQSVSAYVLGAGGANVVMKVASPEEPLYMQVDATSFTGTSVRMHDLIEFFSERLGRPVLDQTGLTQRYDFTVDWKVNVSPRGPTPEVLASALQTQLGLTLTSTTGPVDFLIVEHVEEPSPN
jgi:uncharacterized protein (TIGR03435 family)